MFSVDARAWGSSPRYGVDTGPVAPFGAESALSAGHAAVVAEQLLGVLAQHLQTTTPADLGHLVALYDPSRAAWQSTALPCGQPDAYLPVPSLVEKHSLGTAGLASPGVLRHTSARLHAPTPIADAHIWLPSSCPVEL